LEAVSRRVVKTQQAEKTSVCPVWNCTAHELAVACINNAINPITNPDAACSHSSHVTPSLNTVHVVRHSIPRVLSLQCVDKLLLFSFYVIPLKLYILMLDVCTYC
jgi:hypothetical protein